jgi:D-sedoheptulose 7-phosphate isomerase
MRPQVVLQDYTKALQSALVGLDLEAIRQAADILFEAWRNSRSVFVCGNGGSWSTAEHFATDLRKWSRVPGSGGVRAHALTLGPLVTAYANDHEYAEVFSRQLSDLAQPHDVVVGISCSGASRNVINALYHAERFEGRSIALTGPDGMRPHWFGNFQFKAAELEIRVQAEDIRIIEDCHLAICHMLAGEVRDRIAKSQETERSPVT